MTKKFLEKDWLTSHAKKIREKAGPRYTPELNVDLPISDVFDGLCRTKDFYISIRKHYGKLQREFFGVSDKYQNKITQKAYNNFSKEILELLKLLKPIKEYSTEDINWNKIGSLSKKSNRLSWELEGKIRQDKEEYEKNPDKDFSQENRPSKSDRFSSDIHDIYETQKELRFFQKFSTGISAQLSNKPFFLLKGLAGSGKTHLLCDVTETRIKNNFVSILLFGEYFSKGDFWDQIFLQLDLSKKYSKDLFLKRLNARGKKSKNKSLLMIDALNEAVPMNVWKKNIAILQKEIKKYPHIALVISVRSGFENEVINTTAKNKFTVDEHIGFQFREWEAVTKFFNEFSIPLPEIPLLMPEFQNPLFLLLFCKAFRKRKNKKGKQIFRGHEGTTYIFETYVDSISKKIEDDFNIDHGPNKNIWDTIIEKIASEMVNKNIDKISEDTLIEIVKKGHPKIKYNELIKNIEKSFLLVKVPHYSIEEGKAVGFDYRFPFQKFSDHLIARFIFKKYKKSKKTPKRFFGKNTKIGKFIKNSWNLGIIEALSIQCPEWLKGVELFELAPYIEKELLVKAFIESLMWRRPNAFSKDLKKILDFINTNVVIYDDWNDKLLNAFLSITAIPEHPFNAEFFSRHLTKFKMPNRDAWWIPFLHYQYGEHNAIDRLIEWGWSDQDKNHICDQSIMLYATTLIWFLASSDRFLRDKTTKVLVCILQNRPSVILQLLEKFKKIDDPYIIERLYAAIYGCALRNRWDRNNLKKIAKWFLKNVFSKDKIPEHILIRDYARGVIECAIKNNIFSPSIRSRVNPPFGSKWPKRIPAEKKLKEKYYPEDFFKDKTKDRGFLSIWSSIFDGDFGRYKINYALGNWSGRKIKGKEIDRKAFFDNFKKELSKEQLDLLNKLNFFFGFSFKNFSNLFDEIKKNKKGGNKEDVDIDYKKEEEDEKKKRKKYLKEFKKSLTIKKRGVFVKEIEPYLDDRGGINDPLKRFNIGLGKRLIFNEVVRLGWTSELHGKFDENLNRHKYDRSEHKSERIGKKYQWIALHKALSLIADNFKFIGDRSPREKEKYEGVWQIGARDIDPSCVLKNNREETKEAVPRFNKYKPDYNLWGISKKLTPWLKDNKKLPNPKSIIELTDENNQRWLLLEGFCEWQDEIPPEQEKFKLPRKTLYYMVKSYLVKNNNKENVFNWSKKQRFYGRWMPESSDFYNVHLGEYPSYPAFLYHYIPYYHHDGWTRYPREGKIPANILVTDDQYLSSGSSIDCSMEEALGIKLPAKWIVDKMKLTQIFVDGRFFDKKNDLVAFDPTIYSKDAPSYLLIRKDKLIEFLKKQKCSIFWTLTGEKQTIGGGKIGQPYGWQEISGSYTLNEKNKIVGFKRSVFKEQR